MPRNNRKRYNHNQSNNAAWVIVLALVVGVGIYFGAAGLAGDWLAKNVVSPVMGWLGIWNEDQQPAQTPAPTGTEKQPATPAQTANAANNIQVDVQGLNVFFLQTGAFESKENAETESTSLQSRGGAGYVAEEGCFWQHMQKGKMLRRLVIN